MPDTNITSNTTTDLGEFPPGEYAVEYFGTHDSMTLNLRRSESEISFTGWDAVAANKAGVISHGGGALEAVTASGAGSEDVVLRINRILTPHK